MPVLHQRLIIGASAEQVYTALTTREGLAPFSVGQPRLTCSKIDR
ncbi:MAG: hypothetical protein ABW019_00020 [Chitinophagaceae bacterium]